MMLGSLGFPQVDATQHGIGEAIRENTSFDFFQQLIDDGHDAGWLIDIIADILDAC